MREKKETRRGNREMQAKGQNGCRDFFHPNTSKEFREKWICCSKVLVVRNHSRAASSIAENQAGDSQESVTHERTCGGFYPRCSYWFVGGKSYLLVHPHRLGLKSLEYPETGVLPSI
jgi:hypothetical protein